MITLKHAIQTKATPARAFHALTQQSALQQWHVGAIQGNVAPGTVMTLTPHDRSPFTWRTDAMRRDERIDQTCTEGPGSAVGKTLSITVTPSDDGRTRIEFAHGGWDDGDPHLALCNTYWGSALTQLRTYLDSSEAQA